MAEGVFLCRCQGCEAGRVGRGEMLAGSNAAESRASESDPSRWRWREGDTRATPKFAALAARKNTNPTYFPRIQGWDLWWLELLEVLVAVGSLATNNSNHHKS